MRPRRLSFAADRATLVANHHNRNAHCQRGRRPGLGIVTGAHLYGAGTQGHGVERNAMKKFLAIYIGTDAALRQARWNELSEEKRKALQDSGVQAWMEWGRTHSAAIADQGSPLGKTKRASRQGISDTRNSITGYVIVEAESHDAAAKLFENHPHFTIFPGESVEIMECLPLPRP
jgi:hypothetical protein